MGVPPSIKWRQHGQDHLLAVLRINHGSNNTLCIHIYMCIYMCIHIYIYIYAIYNIVPVESPNDWWIHNWKNMTERSSNLQKINMMKWDPSLINGGEGLFSQIIP